MKQGRFINQGQGRFGPGSISVEFSSYPLRNLLHFLCGLAAWRDRFREDFTPRRKDAKVIGFPNSEVVGLLSDVRDERPGPQLKLVPSCFDVTLRLNPRDSRQGADC